MTMLLDLWTIVLVSMGVVFFLAGTVGLLRFPDALSRLHALTKADNLGLGLVVIGLLPRLTGIADGAKMIFVWLLVMLSGACLAQLVAHLIRQSGDFKP
ncbi:monovalent cation/H(+) antiporter subunit G [Novosphingobium sp. PhB165]|uniref:monovalent cation/H(+) antiporter subunit G n=1 Tax=Novosphingobium sp. PhB165 TaxID=2485105 RepID=UPI00104FEB78|nr:monovalent cation/H(+) antiporter subunit G [Novosphingobium sp. PhB165]